MCKTSEKGERPWTSEHGAEPHVSAEESVLLPGPHSGILLTHMEHDTHILDDDCPLFFK